MKFLFLTIVACYIAYSISEKCQGTDTGPCIHTICDNTTAVQCVNGLCSCEPTLNLKCTTMQDCLNLGDTWNCAKDRRHCIDNMCTCIRLPA
ncbi:serine protease inhibitor Cvsi-2-like [Mytilus galloprovincialis]|uniref:serine protease inhibitor Cvsi-2-like n=1 Tax=Mytilus galloprovincialis TaxID=29158 RepID=UPI003F7C10B2